VLNLWLSNPQITDMSVNVSNAGTLQTNIFRCEAEKTSELRHQTFEASMQSDVMFRETISVRSGVLLDL
jgi:hypothetical protein